MTYVPLVLGLLLTPSAAPLPAQTPATTPAAASSAAGRAFEAHLAQYYADLNQRLRDIYFAPSDGRAITLLSTATEEFGARRRGLRQELQQLRTTLKPAERQALTARLQRPDWTQPQQAVLNSPAAAKLTERIRRNPALETAFQRFTDAQLAVLEPPAAR
ncbi:hypothetical protein LJ737_17870 [Hymenobacter sp. 15J16-1T3B]|uniref:hypothetical protein n=1 Tax=Hymenobacter sp. 15J16-1T3B TaxID=2886941 RepID=UPI001D10AF41|nr:hypothetical protein [Hymenobacter sp. 15J16-1T3B]MCC3159114.1 hypothetical protein [Hymenobacter sp. 15J16-1T3B]